MQHIRLQLFEPDDGAPEKVGKAIGAVITVLIYVAVAILMIGPILR